MLFKIFLLLLGLGLLFLHQKLLNQVKITATLQKPVKIVPLTGIQLTQDQLPSWEIPVFQEKLLVIPMKQLWKEQTPDLTYLQALKICTTHFENHLILRFFIFSDTLDDLHILLDTLKTHNSPFTTLEITPKIPPSIVLQQNAAKEIFTSLFSLLQKFPHLQIIASGAFAQPVQLYQRVWNQLLHHLQPVLQGYAISLQIQQKFEEKKIAKNLAKVFVTWHQVRQHTLQRIPPVKKVYIHSPQFFHSPSHWVHYLSESLFLVSLLNETSITGISHPQKATISTPEDACKSLVLQASREKETIQPLLFNSNSSFYTDAQGHYPSLSGWAFHKNWQTEVLVFNLSEEDQTINVSTVFVKNFFYEQLTVHSSNLLNNNLSLQDLLIKKGKKSGSILLPPYSISRLSSNFFLSNLPTTSLSEEHQLMLSPSIIEDFVDIHYQLFQREKVSIRVFDKKKHKKFGWENHYQSEGKYEIRLNTNKLSSGVYQVQLCIGKQQGTRWIQVRTPL